MMNAARLPTWFAPYSSVSQFQIIPGSVVKGGAGFNWKRGGAIYCARVVGGVRGKEVLRFLTTGGRVVGVGKEK